MTALRTLLLEALAHEGAAFELDEPVDGGDLVQWFSGWRERVQAAFAHEPAEQAARAELLGQIVHVAFGPEGTLLDVCDLLVEAGLRPEEAPV